jgi:cytochrome c-type biogenesis protein CcmH/NrfF
VVRIAGDPRRRAIALSLASFLAALALAGGALAAQEAAEPPSWAYQLPHDLMSPFCPGRTLAECPSPQADQLRLWILTQAAAGASREELESALYQRFGDQIRSAPRASGWGWSAYAIPIAGFLLGGGLVVFALRRIVRRGSSPAAAASPVAPPPGDPELERLLDEELRSP